ncbi:unnamed protein product [marine sediment metagenome]|uniref:Uncharacterized protein n=1 Tax=marine sediment metagenome TaxID=412755 RepID=X1E116_9ZZZZ
MSYRKCEWCGQYLRDYTFKCPSCGENNANSTAKDDLIINLMNKDELILRIMNLARGDKPLQNLKKMTRQNLRSLYLEMKKDKKRCE